MSLAAEKAGAAAGAGSPAPAALVAPQVALQVAHTLSFAGASLTLDPSGALWLAEARTLVVADLHLEKASSFARSGSLLPPYDSRATLARLTAVVARLAPARIVALGDSFHDRGGPARLGAEEAAALAALAARHALVWITGNHDPELPEGLGGRVVADLAIGPLAFCHLPSAGRRPGEVCGHLHPVVSVAGRGRAVRRRCFASDGARLVLPAFGALAGGLDLRDAAFADVLARAATTAYALGTDRIYPIALARPRGGR